jgi:hypothetical protein
MNHTFWVRVRNQLESGVIFLLGRSESQFSAESLRLADSRFTYDFIGEMTYQSQEESVPRRDYWL